MVEVCEGAPVAVSGWVLADRHDLRPCAASSLHRGTISVSNIMGGTGRKRERRTLCATLAIIGWRTALSKVPCSLNFLIKRIKK